MTTKTRRGGTRRPGNPRVADRWYFTKDNKTLGKKKGDATKECDQGARWKATYNDNHGKPHSKLFATKRDAWVWLNKQTTALGTGRHVAPRDAGITVARWGEFWLENNRGRPLNTYRSYKRVIRRATKRFGQTRLDALTASMIISWVADMQAEPRDDPTVYQIHQIFAAVLDDACLDGVLGSNPCSKRTSASITTRRRSGKRTGATEQQVLALREALPDRLKIAVDLGAYAGLRISEACGLRFADVDCLHHIISLGQQYPVRGGLGADGLGGAKLKSKTSYKPIPITPELTRRIEASVQRFGGPMVLTNATGGPLSADMLHLQIRKARRAAGLPESLKFHSLRHFFLTTAAKSLPPEQVRDLGRHSSIATTYDMYVDEDAEAADKARAVFNDVIGRTAAEIGAPDLRPIARLQGRKRRSER